jgi:hypothetical protein
MTEKKEPVKEDDPNQSEAFRKAVRDLEAAGELNDTEAESKLTSILSPKKKRPTAPL